MKVNRSHNNAFKVGDAVSSIKYVPHAEWIQPGASGVVVEVAESEITGMDETLYIVHVGGHNVAYAANELESEKAAS